MIKRIFDCTFTVTLPQGHYLGGRADEAIEWLLRDAFKGSNFNLINFDVKEDDDV